MREGVKRPDKEKDGGVAGMDRYWQNSRLTENLLVRSTERERRKKERPFYFRHQDPSALSLSLSLSISVSLHLQPNSHYVITASVDERTDGRTDEGVGGLGKYQNGDAERARERGKESGR